MNEAANKNGLRYGRILLKLSGEALMGDNAFGFNSDELTHIGGEVKKALDLGCQVAIVVGGGNICRGGSSFAEGVDRATADYMGMMATVMNGLTLADRFERMGMTTRVQSAFDMQQVVEMYARPKALQYLEEGKIVIFAGGTGNPFFTTDTAAALRGAEMNCDVVLKATKVDGVYDCDPVKNKAAKKFEAISFDDVIAQNLKVMDATAFALCRERDLPIIVFNVNEKDAIPNIIKGKQIGTLVS